MLRVYHFATRVGTPLIRLLLWHRLSRGREDAERIGERQGVASVKRPKGRLIWIHAASVGEALSVLPLIERLVEDKASDHLLVTTGTVSSAKLLAERLPARAIHQYFPLDQPEWIERFLDHWRPTLGLWVESELWPNLLAACRRRGMPMVLINARLSSRSYDRWRRFPSVARELLGCFDLILAPDDRQGERLKDLGAGKVVVTGNLKFAARPLPCQDSALKEMEAWLGERPRWLAASTHPGEEAIVARVHKRLAGDIDGLLTVIAPRHPGRAKEIRRTLTNEGLSVAQRSLGETPQGTTEVYLADTLGELGLFYRIAPIAFIGGSLVEHGGQNPLEAARLTVAILHGPHMENFADIVEDLDAKGGAQLVEDESALADALRGLLESPQRIASMAEAGLATARDQDNVLQEILTALKPLLPKARRRR